MEQVKIPCRCGECIVGEEVENDGVQTIFCHPKQTYMNHESFCDTGRKKVVQEDGTFEPEYYHRCTKCTAILNHMGHKVNYCADCGTKVEWEDVEQFSGNVLRFNKDGSAELAREFRFVANKEEIEKMISLLTQKDQGFIDSAIEVLKSLWEDKA